jgi:competence protein ComEC
MVTVLQHAATLCVAVFGTLTAMQQLVYAIAGGFFLGAFVRSFVEIPLVAVVVLLLVALAALGYTALIRSTVGVLCIAALLAVLGGIVRTELAQQAVVPEPALVSGASITVVGTVITEPDQRDTRMLVVVDVDEVMGEPAALRMRLTLDQYPRVAYGDRLVATGTVEVPEVFETDTGRTFNYPMFLTKDGIQYVMFKPEFEVVAERQGNPLREMLFSLKQSWLTAVGSVLTEPQSSLLGGLVVGAKQSLGERWLERFRETGIIHIVVLSGFNLTIVAVAIARLTAWLPRRGALGLALLGIVCFALLTGGGATVVRASIMAALALIAQFIGRPYMIVRALAIAAFLMVLHNPFVLAFDPGFQLSFVATLGLVLGSGMVLPYLSWLPLAGGVREIVAATIATQIAVLPLLLFQIGQFSVVALLVNVLILPLVPATMAVGFGAGVLAMISPILAYPLALASHVLLVYMFTVVEWFARVPYAAVNVPAIPFVVVCGAYVALGWLTYTWHRRETVRKLNLR